MIAAVEPRTNALASPSLTSVSETTACTNPFLSPKWWYSVGGVTPAASQIARLETSPVGDVASSSAVAWRIRASVSVLEVSVIYIDSI